MSSKSNLLEYIMFEFLSYRNIIRKESVKLCGTEYCTSELIRKQQNFTEYINKIIERYYSARYSVNYIKYIALKDMYRYCFTDEELVNMLKKQIVVNIEEEEITEVVIDIVKSDI